MGKIVWKVISKETWGSAIVPKDSKYHLRYKKGEIVKAPKGTLGIFCFVEKREAINFLQCNAFDSPYDVIKVKGIGEEIHPKKVCYFLDEEALNHFYKNENVIKTKKIPVGTICYPAVKVLK